MTATASPRAIGLVLATAALLWAATPPARVPFGEFLIGPGLMGCYALATAASLRASYLAGLLYMAAFSFSVRHVLFFPWVFIAVVGGLYHLAAAVCTRKLRRLGPWGFGIAVAGACWLRAEMPEICYPHGQPAHVFWEWPRLLGAVALGGEPLVNLLLGASAAAVVDAWRSWRLAVPARRSAWLQVAAVMVVAGALTWAGQPPALRADRQQVQIAAIEPGLHPQDAYAEVTTRQEFQQRFRSLLEERWLRPTLAIAGRDAAEPPDLVLWPESTLFDEVVLGDDGRATFTGLRGLDLHRRTRLCVGAALHTGEDLEPTPASVLVGHDGRYLGHHEKQRLVPGGEFLPFVDWLPGAVAGWIRRAFESALGSAPGCPPGRPRPPLLAGADVPFASLMCYDNAFPGPALTAVQAGARLLVVLSNEAWYRGGAELDQMVAMTVLRALETRTPIVRCTIDGRTVAVDADGRLLGGLPPAPTPTPAARTFRISMPVRDAGEVAVAWPGPWLGLGAGIAVLLAILHGLRGWARLRAARPVLPADRPGTPVPTAPEGGS